MYRRDLRGIPFERKGEGSARSTSAVSMKYVSEVIHVRMIDE